MKFLSALFLVIIVSFSVKGQNVAINTSGANPNASAMLDIVSTNKGLLIPRVSLSATNSTNPVGAGVATSLLVYNTATAGTAPNNVTPGYYFWDATKWVRIFDANTSADDFDWEVNGNNVYTGHGGLYPSANVGIGTTTPGNKLTVRATTPSGYFVGSSIALNWVGTGAQAYALSVNAAKTASSTSGRSTAIIATGGNATNKYNTGISAVLKGTNEGSAIVTGIETEYPFDLGYYQYQWTGPSLSGQWGLISWSNVYFDKNNYTMGNVGIGTTTPTAQLHTTGSVRFQGAGTPSAGRVLTSDASGNATWQDPSGSGDDEDWEVIGSNVVTGHGGLYPTGNVGIGTTAPTQKLTIINNTPFTLAGNATGVDNLYLENHSMGGGDGNYGGSVSFSGPYNGGSGAQRRHAAIVGVQVSAETDYVGLAFFTHNNSTSTGNMQESMRLTHIGNLGIGTTTPSAKLQVNQTSTTANGALIQTWASSTSYYSLNVRSSSTSMLYVRADGNVGIGTDAPSYKLHVMGRLKTDGINETSDIRLKKNILTIESPLNKVMEMRGVTYEWIDDTRQPGIQMGMIAQEVEKIIPEVVDEDENGYKSIQYSVVVSLLVEAVKEQQQSINTYDAKLNELSKKIEELQKEIEKLKTQ